MLLYHNQVGSNPDIKNFRFYEISIKRYIFNKESFNYHILCLLLIRVLFRSFFQSVCLLGYCIFPLVIATIVTSFWTNKIFRLVCVAVGFVWSTLCKYNTIVMTNSLDHACLDRISNIWYFTLASIGFFAGMVPPNRKALATYPVFLFYLMISWMILIQSWNGTKTTPLSPSTPVASPVAA